MTRYKRKGKVSKRPRRRQGSQGETKDKLIRLSDEMSQLIQKIDELNDKLDGSENKKGDKSTISMVDLVNGNISVSIALAGIGLALALSVFSIPTTKTTAVLLMVFGSMISLGGSIGVHSNFLFQQCYLKNPQLVRELNEIGPYKLPFGRTWHRQYSTSSADDAYRKALRIEASAFSLIFCSPIAGFLALANHLVNV